MKLIGRDPCLKIVSTNQHGILFSVNPDEKYSDNHENIIYINGSQFGHYKNQRLDNGIMSRTRWMRQYAYGSDCDFYDESHPAYIFKYIVSKKEDDMFDFSKSLLEVISYLNTDQNILVGKSYGGIIATIASQSELIKKCILVHPDLQGSPLANPKYLSNYLKYQKEKAKFLPNILDHFTVQCAYANIMPGYSFTNDTANGYPEFTPNEKLVVYGNWVTNSSPINNIAHIVQKISADSIYRMTGFSNDGVVIFDPKFYQQKGIEPILLDENPYHDATQDPKVMKKIYRDQILRK